MLRRKALELLVAKMTPRAALRRAKIKKRSKNAKLFMKYFGNTNDQSEWKMEKISKIPRRMIQLSGLITYESAFTEERKSSLKEFLIVSTLGTIGGLNWMFEMKTLFDTVGKDYHLVMLLLPIVLRGFIMTTAVIICYAKRILIG